MSSLWPFSSWSIPVTLQKRLLKFLLKRAVGQFLSSELDLDNLDLELGKGQVVLRDLDLNVDVRELSFYFSIFFFIFNIQIHLFYSKFSFWNIHLTHV